MRNLITAVMLLALAACSDPNAPWFTYAGGGFIFNYRLAEAYYGFVIRPARALPEGGVFEAEFEDPAGGPPIRVTTPVRTGQVQYEFRTPGLKGVKAKRPYRASVRLFDRPGGKELGAFTKDFESEADQASLPSAPLVIGPGYTPNPDASP